MSNNLKLYALQKIVTSLKNLKVHTKVIPSQQFAQLTRIKAVLFTSMHAMIISVNRASALVEENMNQLFIKS